MSHPLLPVRLRRRKGRVGEDVGNMTRLRAETDAPQWSFWSGQDDGVPEPGKEFLRPVRGRRDVKGSSVEGEDATGWRLTETEGIREDRVEHGFHARR